MPILVLLALGALVIVVLKEQGAAAAKPKEDDIITNACGIVGGKVGASFCRDPRVREAAEKVMELAGNTLEGAGTALEHGLDSLNPANWGGEASCATLLTWREKTKRGEKIDLGPAGSILMNLADLEKKIAERGCTAPRDHRPPEPGSQPIPFWKK